MVGIRDREEEADTMTYPADPFLTKEQALKEIERINTELYLTKQELIRKHGSWDTAQRKGDLKAYSQLLKDRKAYWNRMVLF